MSKEPVPESKDTSTAANHSFPANTSCKSEKRRKRKSGKNQALSQLLALEVRKIEQLGKAVQQKWITSSQEDEDYKIFMSFLPHLRDKTKTKIGYPISVSASLDRGRKWGIRPH
jgi:hypothetical protein